MTTFCAVCGFPGPVDAKQHRCAADPQYWPKGMEIPTSRICAICKFIHRGSSEKCPIIEEAAQISGWMDESELAWLAKQASTRHRIVEFGCYMGRSTKALAMATRGTVYAVDWWVGSMEHEVYPAFLKNLAAEIQTGKLVVCRGHTARAFTALPEPADMVFIDASHDYESVRNDIGEAGRLLSGGGLLSGHDFSNEFSGVIQAVAESVPEFQRGPGAIWYAEI